MLHPIEKSRTAVKDALHAMRGWIHPKTVMKDHAFDRPLDDLGQPAAEEPPAPAPPAPPDAERRT